jgi:hypothetical protein
LQYTVLDEFIYASRILCSMPDDVLDVAETYVTRKSTELGDAIRRESARLEMDAMTHDLAKGVETIQLEVKAMNTPLFQDAHELAAKVRAAVQQQLELTQSAVLKADESVHRATSRLKRSLYWVRGVRLFVLSLAAIFSWAVGFGYNNWGPWLQFIAALATFVILELLVGERLVEPRLTRYRRARLREVVNYIHDQYHKSDVELSALRGIIPQSSSRRQQADGHVDPA